MCTLQERAQDNFLPLLRCIHHNHANHRTHSRPTPCATRLVVRWWPPCGGHRFVLLIRSLPLPPLDPHRWVRDVGRHDRCLHGFSHPQTPKGDELRLRDDDPLLLPHTRIREFFQPGHRDGLHLPVCRSHHGHATSGHLLARPCSRNDSHSGSVGWGQEVDCSKEEEEDPRENGIRGLLTFWIFFRV